MALQASRRSILHAQSSIGRCVSQRWRFSTSIPRRIETIQVESTSPAEAALSSASAHSQLQPQASQGPTLSDALPLLQQNAEQAAARKAIQYHVSRTPSNNLPVYHDTRNGGTRRETIIRKISGDPALLRDAIRDYLGVAEDRVWVGKVTGHVYVKGHHKATVDKFLVERGF